MRVILAGFNVDIEALQEYKNGKVILTPESISAAYARISRSPKSVDGLRKEARFPKSLLPSGMLHLKVIL